jgi:hypothetical protein
MNATLMTVVFSTVMLLAPSFAANPDAIQDQLKGTWSGGWVPDGGVRDAMTIELKFDESGKLTGRFVTPVSMNFSRATFNTKTRSLQLEAADVTSGKQYRLNAKVEGTEIKGTVAADNQGGQVHLIKWTYVPPIK